MGNKANPKFIGAFVVGAVALSVIGALVFGSGKFFANTIEFVAYFEGNLSGLDVGAPVEFKGVKIGTVSDIKVVLRYGDLSLRMPVMIELEPDRVQKSDEMEQIFSRDRAYKGIELFIKQGLRAQLNSQSFVTGKLKVELEFHPDTPIHLFGKGDVPELPTIPSTLEQLSEYLSELPIREIVRDLSEAIQAIEQFAKSPEIKGTLKSTEQSMKELASLIRNIDGKVEKVVPDLRSTLKEIEELTSNMDEQVGDLSTNVEETLGDTRRLVHNIDERVSPLLSNLNIVSESTRETLEQLKQTISKVDKIIDEDSPLNYKITNTVEELEAAARSIRILADYLERHPESLIRGKGESERN